MKKSASNETERQRQRENYYYKLFTGTMRGGKKRYKIDTMQTRTRKLFSLNRNKSTQYHRRRCRRFSLIDNRRLNSWRKILQLTRCSFHFIFISCRRSDECFCFVAVVVVFSVLSSLFVSVRQLLRFSQTKIDDTVSTIQCSDACWQSIGE